MKKPKVLQILPMYHQAAEEILNSKAEVIRTDDYSMENLCELVKEVDAVVLRAPARIEKEVIDANPHLKVISGAGVGLDNIDVAYATKMGIPVLHAPSVNKVSTAEHTVMFIMALSKSLLSFHKEMEKGNFDSRNRISTQELKGKKVGLIGFGSSAYLINTARGAVINPEDLYTILSSNTIAGAALDVFEVEPIPQDSKLLSLSNVLLTPHVGGTTKESNYIMATTVAQNVINFLNGEEPEFVANPSVLGKNGSLIRK